MTQNLAIHNDAARRMIRAVLDGSNEGNRRYLRRALSVPDSQIRTTTSFRGDPEADAIVNAAEYCDFLTPELWRWLTELEPSEG